MFVPRVPYGGRVWWAGTYSCMMFQFPLGGAPAGPSNVSCQITFMPFFGAAWNAATRAVRKGRRVVEKRMVTV